jgi:carbonic anhydrase/acetyltransferase-like protein (isoleucine patch superfamily)
LGSIAKITPIWREGVDAVAIYALGELVPQIADSAYVHPDAVVIGAVTIGPESTIWPGAVLRGDLSHIEIGARTSIQDGTIVHVAHDRPTIVGDDCVVGHNAYLEGCIIEDHVLVASMSVVLPRVTARSRCVIAAGAMVQSGTEIPSQAMALGVPAKVRLGAATTDYVDRSVLSYVANGARYRNELRRLD